MPRSSGWYGRSKSTRREARRRRLKSLRSISFIVKQTAVGRSPGISPIRPPGERCRVRHRGSLAIRLSPIIRAGHRRSFEHPPARPFMPLFVIPFPAIDPVAISLGPFAIRWYALAYIVGLLIGWRYCLVLDGRPPSLV